MEQIAQSTFYHAHMAPMYWWFVGAFILGISGLFWCLWQSVHMAVVEIRSPLAGTRGQKHRNI